MFKAIGKNPSGSHLKKIRESSNYYNGAFHNLEPTEVTLKEVSSLRLIKGFFSKPDSVKPAGPLGVAPVDLRDTRSESLLITWFGHSSYFIHTNKYTILVDPVFSGYASPVAFIGKSFLTREVVRVEELPDIDLLIITHDHYDHLDYATIRELRDKVKRVVTPLGVGAHLRYWGYSPESIIELDWWEELELASDLCITCMPARHFSGRGVRRNQTLWGSFALRVQGSSLFLGGDSGYGRHFEEIGERMGAFDLAILECGQYGEFWPYIHMLPEQTLQAALDLNSRILMPVHWAKFVLAFHPWDEPIERLTRAAENKDIEIIAPRPGEIFSLNNYQEKDPWWKRTED